MRSIRARAQADSGSERGLSLCLDFERRQRTRQRVVLSNGEEAALSLPRGEILRGGDLLLLDDDRVVRVVAAPERLLHVTCADAEALARIAYHLGNRHVAVQVGEGWLRIAPDHVLAAMVRGLGARTGVVEDAFEPEGGAYSHSHGQASEPVPAEALDYGSDH